MTKCSDESEFNIDIQRLCILYIIVFGDTPSIGNTSILIPSLSEQREIVEYIDKKCAEIESVIADKKKQLEVLDNYKKSLIYEYVTGKKEVVNE